MRAAVVVLWAALFAVPVAADNPNYPKPGERFADDAAQLGMTEVEAGKLAKERASNADVSAFGEALITVHTRLNSELKRIVDRKGFELPDELSDEQREQIEALSKLNGRAFDAAFIEHARESHRLTLAEFQRESNFGRDPEIKGFAAATIPILQRHLRMADDIDVKLGGKNR